MRVGGKKVADQLSTSLRCITIANELITALMQYGRKVFRPFKRLKLRQAEWRRRSGSASGGSTPQGSASFVRRNKWPLPRFHENLIEFCENHRLIARVIGFVLSGTEANIARDFGEQIITIITSYT